MEWWIIVIYVSFVLALLSAAVPISVPDRAIAPVCTLYASAAKFHFYPGPIPDYCVFSSGVSVAGDSSFDTGVDITTSAEVFVD